MEKFLNTRRQLSELKGHIESGEVVVPNDPMSSWAGVELSSTQPPQQPSSYPAPRYVITPYVKELSWLFGRLRDAFSEHIDHASKIEFFGRLANVANDWHTRGDQTSGSPDLLSWVLWEASVMLDEMEHDEFDHLLVAPGGMIFADAIRTAERGGFLTPFETAAFLAYMNAKHADA